MSGMQALYIYIEFNDFPYKFVPFYYRSIFLNYPLDQRVLMDILIDRFM